MNQTLELEDGVTVRLETVDDHDTDTSWLGRYTDHPTSEEWAANLVVEREWPANREYKYFVGAKWSEKREHVLQDYERMEALNRGDWRFMGIIATVYVNGVEMGSSSLWGVESDSGDDYFLEVARDLVWDAWSRARKKLAELADVSLSEQAPELEWEVD
jgi:hypothetical protein